MFEFRSGLRFSFQALEGGSDRNESEEKVIVVNLQVPRVTRGPPGMSTRFLGPRGASTGS